MLISQREADFQQRILAASRGPQDPMLFWHMFEPDNIPSEEVDDSGVFFPTDEAGFEAMIEEWEAADKAALEAGESRPFAETFGFRQS